MGLKKDLFMLLQTLLYFGQMFSEIDQSGAILIEADDIVLVSYRNLSLTSVPDNIQMNVTHLDLSMNLILSVSAGTFDIFPNLSSIDLSFNRLVALQDDTFPRSLKHINVAGNKIPMIETNAFAGLDKLTNVNLSRNLFKTWDFSVLDDAGETLVHLDLSYNNVEQILMSNISFTALDTIYLNNNRLTSIARDFCRGLETLVNLDMSRNRISNIESQAFFNMSLFEKLNLNDNQLVSLTDSSCVGLNSLLSLDLGSNNLTEVPVSCFTHTNNLKSVILRDNLFVEISEDVFINSQSLTHLDISSCAFLTKIDSNAFVPLANLTELELANNPLLGNFDSVFGNHTNLSKLKVLILDSNRQLKTIPENLLFRLDDLKTLSLQNLELQCDCSMIWLREDLGAGKPLDISVANTTCANHPSPASRLLTEVTVDELVCEPPVIISSSFTTQPPNSASIQVTVSNTGLPWIIWTLPAHGTLILGPKTSNASYGNMTTMFVDRTVLSTVIISTFNITNVEEDWYGEFSFTASNMAGNVSKSFSIDKTSFGPNPDQIAVTQLTVGLAVALAAVCLLGLVCFINIQHTNNRENDKRMHIDSAEKQSILEKGVPGNSDKSSVSNSSPTAEYESIMDNNDPQHLKSYENTAFQGDIHVEARAKKNHEHEKDIVA